VLEALKPAKFEAEMQWNISAKKLNAKEWIAYAPYPQPYEAQSPVSFTAFPSSRLTTEHSKRGQEVLTAWLPVAVAKSARHSFEYQLTYKGTIHPRRLIPRTEDSVDQFATELSQLEAEKWLYESSTFNFTSPEVTAWLKSHELTQREQESQIAFAKRVFLAITSDCSYLYRSDLDRAASSVCESKKSDCGGLSVLFVSALRASGVPARMITGRWAKSARKNQKLGDIAYFQQHVKAEFFAEGVGWVPVDLASSVLYDRGGVRHFGADGQPMIVFHFDCDLVLDSRWFGKKPVDWLQSPAYWVIGQGTLDNTTITQQWKVKWVHE